MTFLIVALLVMIFLLARKFIIRFEPAGIFAIMWILFTICVLPMQYYIALRFTGILYIISCVLLFTLGTIFGDSICHPSITKTTLSFNQQWALPVLIVLFIGAMVNPLYSILLHGFSLEALLSMQDLLNMNNKISEDRYYSGNVTNMVNQFFLIFCYTAPLFGGFCYRWVGKWTKAVCIFTLIPGMFIALTQSMKMTMITGFILWFTGFFVCSFSYGLPLRIKPKHIVGIITGVSSFFGILFFSMVFRTGEISEKTIFDISQKFFTYALGHFHCFDVWFTTNDTTSYSLGTKTFLGISNVLGLEERIQGVYQEYYQVGQNGYYGISNIFTIFRPLIEDFGEAGACLFMFLIGLLSKISLKALEAMKMVYINQTIISAVYAYLLWSFVASFFTYTSYVAMFAIAYFLFSFLQKKNVNITAN